MPEEDIAEIRKMLEALQRSMQRHDRGETVVDVPPVVAIPESKLRTIVREIVQEQIAKSLETFLVDCRRMIHDEVEKVLDQGLPERFALMGLRIDNPDQVEKVRRMFYEVQRDQENREEFRHETKSTLWKVVGVWATIIATALAGFFGLKGGGH